MQWFVRFIALGGTNGDGDLLAFGRRVILVTQVASKQLGKPYGVHLVRPKADHWRVVGKVSATVEHVFIELVGSIRAGLFSAAFCDGEVAVGRT